MTEYFYEVVPDNIQSEYFKSGLQKEKTKLLQAHFDLEKKIANALIKIDTPYENSYHNYDNSYHWSATTGYIAACQLAIAFICTELDKEKSEIGEIVQISSTMENPKQIKETNKVPLKIEFIKYVKKRDKLYGGEVKYSIADDNFSGSIRFIVAPN